MITNILTVFNTMVYINTKITKITSLFRDDMLNNSLDYNKLLYIPFEFSINIYNWLAINTQANMSNL